MSPLSLALFINKSYTYSKFCVCVVFHETLSFVVILWYSALFSTDEISILLYIASHYHHSIAISSFTTVEIIFECQKYQRTKIQFPWCSTGGKSKYICILPNVLEVLEWLQEERRTKGPN